MNLGKEMFMGTDAILGSSSEVGSVVTGWWLMVRLGGWPMREGGRNMCSGVDGKSNTGVSWEEV